MKKSIYTKQLKNKLNPMPIKFTRPLLIPAFGLAFFICFASFGQPKGGQPVVVPGNRGVERRMALVMGNKEYVHADKLRNPGNDALDMSEALKKLGFDVTTAIDSDYPRTARIIREFIEKLRSSDVVVFYYSGHGIGYNGKNYLLPIDANVNCIERVEEHGFSLGRLFSEFTQKQVRTSFLFLDACRNMPELKACQGTTRSITTQGLVKPTNNPRGSMMIFATEEGSTADDNLSGRNGLFTSELLKYLTRPGLGIRAIMDSTATGVEIQSNGSQSPARYDKLLGDFVFVGTPISRNEPVGPLVVSTPRTTPTVSAPRGLFVSVKGTSFKMGAINRPYNEQPLHEVQVGSFLISRYEVTAKEWKDFCQATKRSMPTIPDLDFSDPNKIYWQDKDRFPITNITWFEAVEYANWLSEKQGLRKAYQIGDGSVEWDRTANGYRLPTEAEWEMAARGNSQDLPYPGSRNEMEVGWSQSNSDDRSHAVGGKKPNDLDLYDMSGNVWEWCWDWYDEYYYTKSPKQNPVGNTTGTMRALRGGSWLTSTNVVSVRRGRSPRTQSTEIGFRLVRSE
ncbi:SUMF1/EgtB/PvdO family nonheme iron enzyme [Larkinella bovis]|uniref:SUMF1/EgtB/PvdO family nonheme iron enzyme n=1 Tax=Larkinella bovis TaxID=683041 RepID=A0ABW0IIR4_9BACT